MEKIKININAFGYPMPVVLVGAQVENKPNFLAAAWVSRVNFKPPAIAVALGKGHYTNIGIEKDKSFSVNIPGVTLVKETDYCGIVSGKSVDKSGLFEVFYGDLKTAPMIKQCPLCIECKLINAVGMQMDTLFIGEVVSAYSEEKYLTAGDPDIQKINPFILSMPDNNYWSIGEKVGQAWSCGRQLK
ncbi:MAG: flavin reductase family protein [Candidatus Omnitrophica bacterium]|nr:flavin reductase family protein [Candidatus Omnitrophota bacterium]